MIKICGIGLEVFHFIKCNIFRSPMFENAIESISTFTRPVNTILRTYSGKQIIPGSATLFFVNEEGYAITCKHVIDLLASSSRIIGFNFYS